MLETFLEISYFKVKRFINLLPLSAQVRPIFDWRLYARLSVSNFTQWRRQDLLRGGRKL